MTETVEDDPSMDGSTTRVSSGGEDNVPEDPGTAEQAAGAPPVPGVQTQEDTPSVLSIGSSTSTYKPKKPKFGGLTQIDASSIGLWTGGKPNYGWLELEEPNPVMIHPYQYRPTSIIAQAKSQVYRTKGLENKFSRKSDFHTFQLDVMDHLELHGLDTATYL